MVLSISNQTVGMIGLSLSGSLLLIATWRTCFHFWTWIRLGTEGCSIATLTPRRVFHALLMLAMMVETIAYADLARVVSLSRDRSMADKLGYVLLEVFGRSIFEYLAFSVVTVMWFKTAIEARFVNRDEMNRFLTCLPKILLGWACLLVGISLLQALDIISAGTIDPDGQYKGSSWALRAHLLVEGLSWGFHAILAMICVAITAKRIMYLSTWPQSGVMTRLKIMTKALLPMVLCALCYTTRSLWLIQQFSQMPSAPTQSAHRSHPSWWIGFVWIPTLLPSAMLLYSARKRDPIPPTGDESYSSPLLPTPVPPAEAFISFQRFAEQWGDSPYTPLRIGHDDDDDDDDDTVDKEALENRSCRPSSVEDSTLVPDNAEDSVHADYSVL